MKKVDVLEVGTDIVIGNCSHCSTNTRVLEIVIVGENIVCLLHTYAASIDEVITVGNIVVTITKYHHRILVVREGIVAKYIFSGLYRDNLRVASSRVVEVAVFDDGPARVC